MSYADDRIKLLLGNGYFPNELPKIFTTSSFADNALEILDSWEKSKIFNEKTVPLRGKGSGGGKLKLSNAQTFTIEDTESETFSKPKRGYERRQISITHCVPQALLCREIARGWRSIQGWISRQQFSVDRLEFSQSSERALSEIDFAVHQAKKDYISATHSWIVSTDISRFYPSIYTHSLVWAAYGKERAKSLLYSDKHKGSLADRLDLLVRKCNRNQTVGIPIGPDTSRILAEIISARIEESVRIHNEGTRSGAVDRLQDDWFVGTNTLDQAERTLASISSAYQEFGLEINGSKTSIDRIIERSPNSWVHELSNAADDLKKNQSRRHLKSFTDLAISLQAANLNAPVFSFAISVIEGIDILETHLPTVESFLLLGATLAPQCLNRISALLINIQHSIGGLSIDRIRSRFLKLIESNLESGNIYEVIWLLYCLRGLKVRIHIPKVCAAVEFHRGAVIPLLLLSMRTQGIVTSKLPISSWEARITRESIEHDWTWLLAYEGFRNGWLSDSKSLLSGRLFHPMNSRSVSFLDLSKNVMSTKATKSRRVARAERSRTRVSELIAFLGGHDVLPGSWSNQDYD